MGFLTQASRTVIRLMKQSKKKRQPNESKYECVRMKHRMEYVGKREAKKIPSRGLQRDPIDGKKLAVEE